MALTQSALNAAQRRSIHFDISTRNPVFKDGYIADISNCLNGPINIGLGFNGGLYIKIEIINQKILSMTAINNGSAAISGLNTYQFKVNSGFLAINNVPDTQINSVDIEWTTGYFLLSLTVPENFSSLMSGAVNLTTTSIPVGQVIVESFADALFTGNVQANELNANDIHATTIKTAEKITFGNWEFTKPGGNNIVTLTYKKSSS